MRLCLAKLKNLCVEVEFGWVGGGVNGCVQTHFHVKPNSVELCWGCVEDELRLWQINELYERDEIGKLHKLDVVDELHEVDKLDELDYLDGLDKVDELDEWDEMGKLEELEELEKLDEQIS